MHRSIRRLAIGAALAGIAATGMPALASAAATCSYDPNSGIVLVNDGTSSDNLRIGRDGPLIVVQDGGGGPTSLCASANFDFATVNNASSIVVTGRAVIEADGYTIDMRGGALGPGRTPESDGVSEIEVRIVHRTAPKPEIALLGTPQGDQLRVGFNGVMVGNDDDIDVNLQRADGNSFRASGVVVSGGAGADFLSGRGGPGLAGGIAPVSLSGGDGSDTLRDGSAGQDFLSGGAGNDSLFSDDVNPDVLFGGAGFDRAFVRGVNDQVAADVEDVVRQP